jgi:hypothetical protein
MAEVYTGEDFVRDHSKDGPPIILNERWVFPDGAGMSRRKDVLYDPPDNEYKRLLLTKAYWFELLRQTSEDFNRIKAALRGTLKEGEAKASTLHNKNLPPSGFDALMKLKRIAAKHKAKVDATDALIAKTPEMRAKVEQARREQEAAIKAQSDQVQINTVLDGINLFDAD